MTLRPRTSDRPRRLPTDSEDRFQFWVTVGFIVVIGLVILILLASVAVNYYNAHLRSIATVQGTTINADDWADRGRLTLYRIERAERRVYESLAAGEIAPEVAQTRLQALQQASQNVDQQSIEDLIDLTFQEKLAGERGIAVTDADIDAAIAAEASTPERRQVQAIFVEPETDETGVPTEEQDAAALADAEAAAQALEDGFPFAQVAEMYSTDISRDNGGEYGTLTADNPTDEDWVTAVFELDEGGTTEIVKGADGVYRIGRVTRILPGSEDATFLPELDQRLNREAYRTNVRREELAKKLQEQVVTDATAGDVQQYHLAEIFIEGEEGSAETGGDSQIHASHILYSPNDEVPDPASPLPTDDPAWAVAEQEAQATADELNAITDVAEREERFAEIAREESDDEGSGVEGGDLGFFAAGEMVPEFSDALFNDPELVRGDIVGPVRSDFGYHVIQFLERRGSTAERIAAVEDALAAPDAEFADVARELSEGPEAADGGDLGWLVAQQLPAEVQEQVVALDDGETSDPLFAETGYHIYQMIEQAMRPLDATQRALVRSSAFPDWYGEEKAAAEEDGRITRDPEIFTVTPDEELEELQ